MKPAATMTAEARSMKFTIRDLFWLVLVCALAVGWWVDRRNFRYTEHILLQMVVEAKMEAQAAKRESPYLEQK
jgi:hypothetical protein